MYPWKASQLSPFFTPISSLPNTPVTPEISDTMEMSHGWKTWTSQSPGRNIYFYCSGNVCKLLYIFFVCFLPVLKNKTRVLYMLGKCSTTKLHTQPLLSLMAQLSFPKSEALNYTDKVDMHIPNTVPGQAELAHTPNTVPRQSITHQFKHCFVNSWVSWLTHFDLNADFGERVSEQAWDSLH